MAVKLLLRLRSTFDFRLPLLIRGSDFSQDEKMAQEDSAGALLRALDRLREMDERFARILSDPHAYRFQCVLTDCRCGTSGTSKSDSPSPRLEKYRCDEEYFYPASTIKLCVAVAALHLVHRVRVAHVPDFELTTPLRFRYARDDDGSTRSFHEISRDDTNRSGGVITLAHLIRNVFLVSSNGAHNLLLDFVGRSTLRQFLFAHLGYKHFRVYCYLQDSKFGPRPGDRLVGVEASLASGAVGLPFGDDLLNYVFDPRRPPDSPPAPLFSDYSLGSSYVVSEGDWDRENLLEEAGGIVQRPKDMSRKNQASLIELQDFLIRVCRPDLFTEGRRRFGGSNKAPDILSFADRAWLTETMSRKTTESYNPDYREGGAYAEDWNKLFLPGVLKAMSGDAVRIANKLGQAYGFTLDNAMICDVETGRTFFLAACVYTNENGTLNDDVYQYDLGESLLAALAEACCLELGIRD